MPGRSASFGIEHGNGRQVLQYDGREEIQLIVSRECERFAAKLPRFFEAIECNEIARYVLQQRLCDAQAERFRLGERLECSSQRAQRIAACELHLCEVARDSYRRFVTARHPGDREGVGEERERTLIISDGTTR